MITPPLAIPHLVTAYSAVQSGDNPGKKLGAIDGNWRTSGTVFKDQPVKLKVTFKSPVDWLDVTVNNDSYGAPISLKGMGFDSSDVRRFISPVRGRHTYRFELKERSLGTLEFSSPGGSGAIYLYDISGFLVAKE